MLSLVQKILTPYISLEKSIVRWYVISKYCRESPRKRPLRIEKLKSKCVY